MFCLLFTLLVGVLFVVCLWVFCLLTLFVGVLIRRMGTSSSVYYDTSYGYVATRRMEALPRTHARPLMMVGVNIAH